MTRLSVIKRIDWPATPPLHPTCWRCKTKSTDFKTGSSPVDWGGVNARHMNPFVTVEALAVLAARGELMRA
jgi:hypothetical protein